MEFKSRSSSKKIPLERALSKLGLASRSQARGLIRDDRVKVNGHLRNDPLFPVDLGSASIEVDGRSVEKAPRIVLMLHKPRGVVTTRSDEKGRPTVFSLLKDQGGAYLHAVGRLDLATTGLLLLTNDTRLSDWLTDPQNQIQRVYLVVVRGLITESAKMLLEAGIHDDGELLRARSVVIRKASGKETHLTVTLTQGKNREIRRLFKQVGHELTRLKRISFGALDLGDLPLGESRPVSDAELKRAFPGLR